MCVPYPRVEIPEGDLVGRRGQARAEAGRRTDC